MYFTKMVSRLTVFLFVYISLGLLLTESRRTGFKNVITKLFEEPLNDDHENLKPSRSQLCPRRCKLKSADDPNQFATIVASLYGPRAVPYSLDFSSPSNVNRTYDYIIVGAGSAGSTLAARLTEDRNVRVLIIEAGSKESIFSNVPRFALKLMGSQMDWSYESVPQARSSFGLNGRKIPAYRGKVVGGTSGINFMLNVRGNKRDYDRWEQLGATGWNYSSVSPYFIKMEDSRDPQGDPGYHGTSGPLTISPVTELFPVDRAFLRGCHQYGLDLGDFNGENQLRFRHPTFTIRDGSRCSTGRAYLSQASFRSNLEVILNSKVDKVLFDKNKQAIGVQFHNNDMTYQVFVRREVILSAGVFNTPQILMLSGIGPKKQLNELGIPVIYDSPGVGVGLQDHPFTFVMFTTLYGTSYVAGRADNEDDLQQYLFDRSGPLTSPGLNVAGFWRSKFARDSRPDVLIHEFGYILQKPASDGALNIRQDILSEYLPPENSDGVMYAVALNRPQSHGTVRLASADPRDPPLIDFNLFSNRRDIDVMVEGCKLILGIAKTPAMQSVRPKRLNSTLGECSQFPLDSDPYLRCLIQTLTFTLWHSTSTAKMGSANDIMSVVDPYLRVYGVKKLRVVDASVMPEVSSGNTNIPVIVIAERAADIIKGRVLRPCKLPFTDEEQILSDYVSI